MIGGHLPPVETRGVEVWVATTPIDMRKSFDSLTEVVRKFLGRDPLSGNLFVFRNKSGQLLKVLWWDRDGLTIYYRRLERGTFRFPHNGETAVAISREGLLRLLSGLEVFPHKSSNSTGAPRPESLQQRT